MKAIPKVKLMCADGKRIVKVTPIAIWDYNLNPPIKCITHRDIQTPTCYTVSEYHTGLNVFPVVDRLHSRPTLALSKAIERLDGFTIGYITETISKLKTINS